MGGQGTGMPGRGRPPEPSWPTVIATTVRLWLERHPITGTRVLRGWRGVLALALVIALGTGVGTLIGRVGISSPATPRASSPATPRAVQPGSPFRTALEASVATRNQVAEWITRQVAASAIVACDPAMCAALQADGIPAGKLLSLGTAAFDPLGSDIVVATPAVRSQFGARLESVYAPAVIASFGSGAGRIDVRVTAPFGAAAYESALAADQRARVAAGRQLLRNPRVIVPGAARTALIAGEVDPRVLITLAALAADEPVRIVAFGDPSPGAGSTAPLRGARIAAAGTGSGAQATLRSMLSFLDAQRPPFSPLRASLASASALNVEYAAPSPLGLLGGQQVTN